MEINAEIKIKPDELLREAQISASEAHGRAVLTVDGKPVALKEFEPSEGSIRFTEKIDLKPEHVTAGSAVHREERLTQPTVHREERLTQPTVHREERFTQPTGGIPERSQVAQQHVSFASPTAPQQQTSPMRGHAHSKNADDRPVSPTATTVPLPGHVEERHLRTDVKPHVEERHLRTAEIKPPRTHIPHVQQTRVPEKVETTKTFREEKTFETPAGVSEFEREKPSAEEQSYLSPEYQKTQRGLLTRVADTLIEAERAVAETLGSVVHGTKETVKGAGQAVADTVEAGYEKTADTLASGAEAVKGAGSAVAEGAKKAGEKVVDTTKAVGHKISETGEAIKESMPGKPDIEGRIAESLKPAPGQLEREFEGLEKAKEAVKGLGKGIVETTKEAGHKVAETTKAAGEAVKDTAVGAGEAVKSAGKAVVDTTKAAGEKAVDTTKAAGEKVADTAKAAGRGIVDTTKAAGEGIADTTRAAGEKAAEAGRAVKESMPRMPDVEGRIAESLKPAPGFERRGEHGLPLGGGIEHLRTTHTEAQPPHLPSTQPPHFATAPPVGVIGGKREIAGEYSVKPLSRKEKEEFERLNRERMENLPTAAHREHVPLVHHREEHHLPVQTGHKYELHHEHEFHHLPSPLREQMIEERKRFFETLASPQKEAESALSYHPREHLPPAPEAVRLFDIPSHPSVKSQAERFEHHEQKPDLGSAGLRPGPELQQQGTTTSHGPKGEITVTKKVIEESQTVKPVSITEKNIEKQWKTLDRAT